MVKVRLFLIALLIAWAAPAAGDDGAALKKMAGTWDAVVKMEGMPEAKGTATWKLDLDGKHLFGEFSADFGGVAFQGRDITTYDPAKKKYLAVWVDSMAPGMTTSEGTYDAEAGAMTSFGKTTSMETGEPVETKDVCKFVGGDKMVFTIYHKAGDEFTKVMTVEYTRKK